MMTCDLNMDLLEFCDLQNKINEEESIIFRLVDEQEILCTLYDNECSIMEQNREIFASLGYTYVNEGVKEIIGKIKKGIVLVLNKIKEVFVKFINFITTKFKKKKEEEKPGANTNLPMVMPKQVNVDDFKQDLNTNIARDVKIASDINDLMDKIDELNNMNKYQRRIQQIQEEIENIWNEEKYVEIPHMTGKDFGWLKSSSVKDVVDKLNNNPLLNDLFDAIDEGVHILQTPNLTFDFKPEKSTSGVSIPRELNQKYRKFLKVYNGIRENTSFSGIMPDFRTSSYKEKLISGYFPVFKDDYFSKETKEKINSIGETKSSFKEFSDVKNSSLFDTDLDNYLEYVSTFKKILNNEITPLQNKINSLKEPSPNTEMYEPGYNFVYREVMEYINILYFAYTTVIRYLVTVERIRDIHKQNERYLLHDCNKLDSLEKELFSTIERLSKLQKNNEDFQKRLKQFKVYEDQTEDLYKKYHFAKYNTKTMRDFR